MWKKDIKDAISMIVIMSFIGWFFPEPAGAKITPKEEEGKEYETVIIKKGDTLWDLSGKYYGTPWKWPEFKQYNMFTDPDLIYPEEKLLVRPKEKELTVPAVEYEEKVQEVEEIVTEIIEEIDLVELERLRESKKRQMDELTLRINALEEEEGKLLKKIAQLQQRVVQREGDVSLQQKGLEDLAKREQELREKKKDELSGVSVDKAMEEKKVAEEMAKEKDRFNQFLIFGIAAGIILVGSLSK